MIQMRKGTKMLLASALGAALLGGAAIAGSHGGGNKMEMAKGGGVIEARVKAMKEASNNFTPLVKMSKNLIPFDAAAVKKHADIIAAKLEESAKLFPEGSDKGDTRAKPEIWSNRAEFDAIMKTAIEKAKALASVTSPDQLTPAVRALGGEGCMACHKKFRKPKGE